MSTRTLPPHGSLSRARAHHCGCPACAHRTSEYHQMRRRLIAYGRWQPYVDAEPVRQHVHMLRTYGIGLQRVRALAGVSNGVMSKLLYGDGTRAMPPSKRVRTRTADNILAVKASLDVVAPNALVDGTGTRRRLRALMVVGWPQREMSRRLGADRKTVNEQINAVKPTAYGSTARAVRDLYNDLWDTDPGMHGVTARWVTETKARAAQHRWAPPAAWDDDYIDSPAAVPDLGEKVSAYAALSEDAQWLIDEQGYTREQAAHRLGITSRHLERALTWARDEREAVAAS